MAASIGESAATQEMELREALSEFLEASDGNGAKGGQSPSVLHRRLWNILEKSCEAWASSASATRVEDGESPETGALRSSITPVELQVDSAYTSPPATRNEWLHQVLLGTAAKVFPAFRHRADMFRSQPAEVVLSSAAANKAGDCLALRWNSSLALRVAAAATVSERLGASATIRRIVIEQPPRWVVPKPRSSPRRFRVLGAPVLEEGSLAAAEGADPYMLPLGSFEYAVAGPAAQSFELASPPRALHGLRLSFEGPGWGEDFTCIYRIRAFEALPPA
mmetsp:Transcript_56461/g.127632  ORF Transcript_56461/g.127632 Transcript_56461/m.127632 type:complete len:278 (+) Transcript_56461:123-956(+)